MKNIKLNLKNIFIIVGSVLSVVGLILLSINLFTSNSLESYTDNPNEDGKYKYVSSNVSYAEEAIDDELGVSALSPILIREVEMVQYTNDNGEAKLVLANYQLDSFEIDGTKYENPDFNAVPKSMVFYSDAYLYNQTLKLDDNAINTIVYDSSFPKYQLEDVSCPENEYGLTSGGNYLVSGSEEWQAGDVKVTYYYLDCDTTVISGAGKVSDGVLNLNDSKAFIQGKELTIDETKSIMTGNLILYIALIIIGIMCIVVPFIFKDKFKQEQDGVISFEDDLTFIGKNKKD